MTPRQTFALFILLTIVLNQTARAQIGFGPAYSSPVMRPPSLFDAWNSAPSYPAPFPSWLGSPFSTWGSSGTAFRPSRPASPARQCRLSGACRQMNHGTTLPTTWRVSLTTTTPSPTTTPMATTQTGLMVTSIATTIQQ